MYVAHKNTAIVPASSRLVHLEEESGKGGADGGGQGGPDGGAGGSAGVAFVGGAAVSHGSERIFSASARRRAFPLDEEQIVVLAYFGGFFTAKATSKKEKATNNEEDSDSESESDDDAETFVASGGRSDSNGGDWALRDKIHDINERQRKHVRNTAKTHRYDMRENSAAPAVYSPEDELQRGLYAM